MQALPADAAPSSHSCHEGSMAEGKRAGIFGWFRTLRSVYSGKYLLAVFCFQHVLKGFVTMYAYTSFDFILRFHHVQGPKMQVLKTLVLLPWALKPLLGIVSDLMPIYGYRKSPYISLATLLGATSFWMVGRHGMSMSLSLTVSCFAAMSVQIVSCDLLTEAATAERIRQFPEHGPAMMAYVSGGIMLGDILAAATIGSVLEKFGPRAPCLLCVVPSALMLVPAFTNCLGEVPLSSETLRKSRSSFFRQYEVLILVLTMGLASLSLACLGIADLFQLIEMEEALKLKVVICVAFIVIAAFTVLLNPVIGCMNAFFFLQSTSTISLEGGTFYFFTDDTSCFPLGPHFSVWFYTTGLGLAAAGCGLAAVWIYGQCMEHWRYRNIFLFCNFSWCVVSAASVLVFTRRNLQLGIPDYAFVLGGTVLQNVFERWTYLPGGVLLSQMCPRGMEATMFALLAGCQNLGRGVASYFGAFMLLYLDVTPDGTATDEKAFENLWCAAVIQALAPLVTLWMVPAMIPDAAQTDKILEDSEDGSSATADSPWSQLCAFMASRRKEFTSSQTAGVSLYDVRGSTGMNDDYGSMTEGESSCPGSTGGSDIVDV